MWEFMRGTRLEKAVEIFWFLFAGGLLILAVWLIRTGELEPLLRGFGVWAPVAIIFLKASTLVVAPLGGTPFYLASGALFGPVQGFLLVLVGDTIGSTICFFISRRYGNGLIKFFAGNKNFERIEHAVSLLEDTKSFLKARVAFSGGPELLAYAAGLSKLAYKKFIILHMPFFIPTGLIFVYLGVHLAEATVKYAFLPTIIVFLISMTGFWFLLKDYDKLSTN